MVAEKRSTFFADLDVSQIHLSALENVYEAIDKGKPEEIESCIKELNKKSNFSHKTTGMDTPLIYAIRNFEDQHFDDTSFTTIDKLVDLGVEVNEECNGEYPIHVASSLKYSNEDEGNKVMNLINKLESKNLDVSKKDSNGNTAFHVAAKSGNITVFEILRNKKKKAMSSKNKENKTPIQLAAIHGYTGIMKMLIDNGCELTKEEFVDILRSNKVVDKTQNTEDGNEPITKNIIPTETPKEPRGDRQSRGISNIITRNIQKMGGRSNVKQPTPNSTTLVEIPKSILMVLQFIKGYLKDKQGSKNTWNVLDVKDSNDNTALHIAAELGLVDVCKELLKDEDEANLNIYKDSRNKDGYAALHVAVKVNNFEVLEFLLKSKCEVSVKDRKGQCPLIMALILGKDKKEQIIKALLEIDDDALNKIDSFKTARNQKNILHKLADIGEKERLQVVKFFKSEINIPTKSTWTFYFQFDLDRILDNYI